MSLFVVCPSCHAHLSVDDSLCGGSVACSACGGRVYIAQASFPEFSLQPMQRARRQKPSVFASIVKWGLQFGVTGVTLYLAYLMVNARINPPAPPAVVRHAPAPRRAPRPAPMVSIPEPSVVEELPPADPKPPPPPIPVFAGLPEAVALPPRNDRAIAQFAAADVDAALSLITNCERLTLVGPRVMFAEDEKVPPSMIAGLRWNEGHAEFRWAAQVTDAAEVELRNSLVALTSGDQRHTMALREPKKIAAGKFELKNRLTRLKCQCDWQPEPDSIRFDFMGVEKLPSNICDAQDLHAMAIGSKAVFAYPMEDETAVDTQLRVRKMGGLVAAEFDSRFVLPSGYEKPLTVDEGNLRLTKLKLLLDELEVAPRRATEVGTILYDLRMEMREAEEMRTTVYVNGFVVDDAVLVARKTKWVNGLSRAIAKAEEEASYLADLHDHGPMIHRDYAAIKVIAELSHVLRDVPLSYRFYVVVGDDQIDLIVAE